MSVLPERIESDARAGTLTLYWPDGRVEELPHALLRIACPCSACRAIRRNGGEVVAPAHVRVTGIEPVGQNALNLTFDDGHRRGIYPFALLADVKTTPAW
jgi:DUF971 family protein